MFYFDLPVHFGGGLNVPVVPAGEIEVAGTIVPVIHRVVVVGQAVEAETAIPVVAVTGGIPIFGESILRSPYPYMVRQEAANKAARGRRAARRGSSRRAGR